MKHLKLIAALAMPAMFAACTSEDLYSESNNEPQQMEEVVGYKLLSNGASFQVAGAESRVSASTGRFHTTDLIGLGWILKTNAITEQKADQYPDVNRLYANHMFAYEEQGENSGFKTKGNIYEGWYFSYYPWAYESKMGPKSFVVNPVQKSKSYDDRVSQRLHISHLQFIGENNINQDNGQLELSYQVEKALNILNVRTAVAKGSAFEAKESEGLDDKAIRSITISTGDANQIFAGKLNLDATKLPVYNSTKSADENKKALQDKLYAATNPALAKAEMSASVTTQVGQTVGEGVDATQEVVYKVSEKTALTTLVTPATATLDVNKFNIVVNLDNGYFEVKYKSEAEIEAEEREVIKQAMLTNNAAIQTIVNAYKGAVAAAGETPAQPAGFLTSLQDDVLSVDVKLYDDIFVTDFKHISNIIEWKDAVDLVETLGRTTETFEIDGAIEFTTANGGITEDGELYMPSTCQITVNSSECPDDKNKDDNNLYLNGELTQWPANLISNTWFAVEADGVWNNAHINNQNGRIVNRGTIIVPNGIEANVNKMGNYITNNGLIKVGEYAEVSHVTNNGRIEVVWGSFVRTEANNGIVAYEVTQLDVDTPKRIEILTAQNTNTVPGQNKLASVNTLIVGKNIEIDLTKSINGTGDNMFNSPYGDLNLGGATQPGQYYYGDLSAVNFEINGGTVVSSTNTLDVNNVKMNGGKVNNIVINELTIESGVNNVNVNAPKSINKLEIKGGNSTVYATEIKNSVTAKGRNAIHAEKINGTLTVEGEQHEIVVAELQDVEVKGNAVISNSNIKGDLTVNSGTTKMENVNINGTLTNNSTVVIAAKDFATIGHIVNKGTLTTNTDIIVNTITLNKGAVTNVFVGDEEHGTTDKYIWYTTPKVNGGYVQAGTTTGKIEYYGTAQFLNDVENAKDGDVVVLKSDVELSKPIAVTKNVTIDLNGKTIKNTTDLWDESKGNWSLISVDNGANVTIKNGKVIAKDNDCFAIDVRDNSVVTIESGEFVGNISAVYCIDGGKAIIKGGKFSISQLSEYSDYRYTLNLNDNSGSSIEVYGGEFFNFDPANNLAEGPNTNFVKEGTSTQNGNWYVVK